MAFIPKIVSVDDNRLNLMLIESMLANSEAEIISFSSPVEAYKFCVGNTVDLMLVDYMMPEMDGISLIKEFRKLNKEIPVIMITAVDDDDSVKLGALEAGATDFLNKPLKLYEFQVRVKNLLALRENQILLKDRAALLEREVEEATAKIVSREIETLAILGRASEFKDTETGAHISRVGMYAKTIGAEIIKDKTELELLYYSTPLHDVGKIGIPDNILLKPGKLTPEEFDIIKTHTTIGYDLLSDSSSKFLQSGAVIAGTHHEKWDGTGYPEGLKGEEIPLFGRIVAVCDVFDALLSVRPYKKAWEFDDARKYILENSGIMFDPEIVKIFETKLADIMAIFEEYKD